MQKKWRLLLLLVCSTSSAFTQPYPTGRRSLTFTDPARGNRTIPTELFYPAAAAGNNTAIAPGTEKFSLVVFGHGFLIPAGSYSWLGDSLSRQGYIVAFPATEGTISPNHTAFGEDIAFLCRHLPTLHDSSGSFLQSRISNRVAAGGHSMGGGASFLAAAGNTGIQALFNFAAAETNPSAKAAAITSNMPSLIFSGSRDCIVPDSNQLRMYLNIPYPCKTYVRITDALHCHFANNNSTCASGQFFSGCNSSPLTAAIIFEKTTQLLIPFLDYYLNNQCGSNTLFENRLTAMNGISFQRSCTADPFTCIPSEYIFTGNGDWSNPTNWLNQQQPPAILPSGCRIRIRPATGGSCILDRFQQMNTGSALIIESGKELIIQGNLSIQ